MNDGPMGSCPHGEILYSNENKCIVSVQDGWGGTAKVSSPCAYRARGRAVSTGGALKALHLHASGHPSGTRIRLHRHTHCGSTKLHTSNLQLSRHMNPTSIKLLPQTVTDEDLVVIGLHKR